MDAQLNGPQKAPVSKLQQAWKAGLSLVLLFHLVAIIVAPNGQNYIGNAVGGVVWPYVGFLNMASSWSFFAPDPGPPPYFVEYELADADGNTVGKGRFPEFPDPYFLRERQNRRIAAARFMLMSDTAADKTLVPHLCRTHPEAKSIRMFRVVYTLPSIEDVNNGKRKIGDDIGADRKVIGTTFCGGLVGSKS